MHKYLTGLAVMLVCSGCKERLVMEMPADTIMLPTLSIRAESDEKAILTATISNMSGHEVSIPGSDGDLIYGSYWYKGDKVINAPECGTGFWDSVIKIPAGETRELRLPVPGTATRGETFMVAVVYGGLGATVDEVPRKNVSPDEWIRHPDITLNCRKMEVEVSLPAE